MAIYQTARFTVKPEALARCRAVVRDFVAYVEAHEPETLLYVSWQEKDDPTQFVHFMMFADESARRAHQMSPGTARFTTALYPDLVSDGVTFGRYTSDIATRLRAV